MFRTILRGIVSWWREKQEENQFVHDTLSELHQKLLVFDQKPNFWTYRGSTYVSVCKGEKFPLYPYEKTTPLFTVNIEKKMGHWFFVTDHAHSFDREQHHPVSHLDKLVADIKRCYGV